jgi:hypothetical protein
VTAIIAGYLGLGLKRWSKRDAVAMVGASAFSRMSREAKASFSREKPFADERRRMVSVLEMTSGDPTEAARRFMSLHVDPHAMSRLAFLTGDGALKNLIDECYEPPPRGFIEGARAFVKELGVVSAVSAIATMPGWTADVSDLIFACAGDPEIMLTNGDVLCVDRLDSVPVTGVRKALSIMNPMPWPAAFGAAARALKSQGLPLPTLDDARVLFEMIGLVDDRDRCRAPGSKVLRSRGLDEALSEIITEFGGLATRRQINDAAAERGYSPNSSNLRTSLSPLVEFACSGVFRCRGKRFDIHRAECLRREEGVHRSRWAFWGWLDDARLWIEAVIENDTVRIAAPGDTGDLLRGRTFALFGPDRTDLGELTLDDSLSGTTRELASTYCFEATRAVMEFNVSRGRTAQVFPGESILDDTDPGSVDGCVLVAGKWGYVVHVDAHLLHGDFLRLPGVLASRTGLEVGDEARFVDRCGSAVRIRREPHGAIIEGAEIALSRQGAHPGDRALIVPSRGTVDIVRIEQAEIGTTADLLSRLGIRTGQRGESPFTLLAAAMGESQPSDRARVAAAFRHRGRRDLAELTESLPYATSGRSASARLILDAALLCSDGEQIAIEQASGSQVIASSKVVDEEAPLGLSWLPMEGSLPDADQIWCRWVRAVIRSWAKAADSGAICLELCGTEWKSECGTGSLLEVLEAVGGSGRPKSFELPQATEPMVPRTGLGFQVLLHDAVVTGISSLRITKAGWSTDWANGRGVGPTSFKCALDPNCDCEHIDRDT